MPLPAQWEGPEGRGAAKQVALPLLARKHHTHMAARPPSLSLGAAQLGSAAGAVEPALVAEVEAFISRRLEHLSLLRAVVAGESYLFGAVLVGESLAQATARTVDARVLIRRWYALATSVGRLLRLGRVDALFRGLAQLLMEYEHWSGGAQFQALKAGVAEVAAGATGGSGAPPAYFPDTLRDGSASSSSSLQPVAPKLHFAGGSIVYEQLQLAATVPYASLGFVEVTCATLDALWQVYSKLLDASRWLALPGAAGAFRKTDARIRTYVLKPTLNTLTTAAALSVKEAVSGPGDEDLLFRGGTIGSSAVSGAAQTPSLLAPPCPPRIDALCPISALDASAKALLDHAERLDKGR